MEIKQTQVFTFSFIAGGTNYNFSIPADTKVAACKTLLAALAEISGELEQAIKAMPKPN